MDALLVRDLADGYKIERKKHRVFEGERSNSKSKMSRCRLGPRGGGVGRGGF